ncbi:MAG: tetratricopeptide repeat protein [Planctomycetia bacterium]
MRVPLVALIFCALCQILPAEESKEPLYRKAIAAFDTQDWSTAAEQFKRAYHRDPTAPEAEDALFFWAESLLQKGKLDEAKERFDGYLRQWPKGKRVRAAHFRVAEALMLDRRYEEAKYRIERFATLYPSDPLLEYATAYLAEIALTENDLAEAERLFNKMLEKYPQSRLARDSRLGLARIRSKQEKWEESLKMLEPILEGRDAKSRVYREAIVLQSNLLAKLGRPDQDSPALSEPSHIQEPDGLQKLDNWNSVRLKSVPESQAPLTPVPSSNQASSSSSISPAASPSQIEQVVGHGLMSDDAMWQKARYFERSGKLEPAIIAYEDLFRKYPRSPKADVARLAAARIYTQRHQYLQARSLYDELLVRSREKETTLDRVTLLFEAAMVEEKLEDTNHAKLGSRSVALLKELLRDFSDSPSATRAAYRLARYEVDAEDFAAARKYLRKSLVAGDTLLLARSLELVWRMAAVENDWATARGAAEQLLALDGNQVPDQLALAARFWIAEADYRTGQYRSARHRFDALAKRIADSASPWAALVALRSAQSLAQMNDFSSARQAAEKGLADFPSFADRYEFDYLIGQCALAQGEYLTARIAFDRTARSPVAQKTGIALLAKEGIASSFFVQEDYESAAAEFTKLQGDDVPPAHRAKAIHYTALCYSRLGRKHQAEALYQRLVDRYPNYNLF